MERALNNAAVIVLSVLLLSPCVSWSAVEVIQEAAHDVSPPLRTIPTDALNAPTISTASCCLLSAMPARS